MFISLSTLACNLLLVYMFVFSAKAKNILIKYKKHTHFSYGVFIVSGLDEKGKEGYVKLG